MGAICERASAFVPDLGFSRTSYLCHIRLFDWSIAHFEQEMEQLSRMPSIRMEGEHRRR